MLHCTDHHSCPLVPSHALLDELGGNPFDKRFEIHILLADFTIEARSFHIAVTESYSGSPRIESELFNALLVLNDKVIKWIGEM